jgi:Lon protease-like protein
MEFPSFIPLFPLPNVVLFPEVPLPLHVFEPRYRAMVRDALAGTGVIGIVLLRGDWEAEYHGAPEVFRVGCAGRIVEATPLADGRFNVVLAGMREFEILSEQRERAYRQATVAWRESPAAAPLPATLRRDLVRRIERHAARSGDRDTGELLTGTSLSDRTLVNFFAFWLDLSPVEKQCLLEQPEGEPRARRLLEILEFHLYAAQGGEHAVGARRMH